MIVLESRNAAVEAWSDPLVEQHMCQFDEVSLKLRKLCPDSSPDHLAEAEAISAKLCEGSRQIVYRMHRVTRQQLQDAVEAFDTAAQLIASWDLSNAPQKALISAYGRHIASRAQLLRGHL